jgi:hypothetical protein
MFHFVFKTFANEQSEEPSPCITASHVSSLEPCLLPACKDSGCYNIVMPIVCGRSLGANTSRSKSR